jgi:tetratricopeptide (TPR) repeat protein
MRSLILAASCLTLPLLAQSTRPAGDPAHLKKLDPAYQRANGCMAPESSSTGAMPLIDGLAKVSFPLAAASPQAQRYFDQGLALLYGFEYEKAERSFARAAALDPECAMCLWGQALAIGPYQNSGPMSEADRARAKALTERALASPKLNAKERALAQALDLRYAPAPPSDDARGVHGVRYAEALAAAAQAYPADDVVVVLAGQAAMEVRPWDYWQADKQTPLPWGARALKLIETVLARNPDQPQAQHLYIHLTEASLSPGRAERAADMLEVAAPASAHLVHMPSHTFYRVGRFDAAIRANRRAIEVDDAMGARLGEAKPYYGYFRHHTHFIVSAAEQRGDAAGARAAAAQLEAAFAQPNARGALYAQALLSTAMQARAQFATAAEMLALPEPTGDKPVLRQIWRALRAEALGREGRIDEAQQELKWMRLERLRVKLPDEAMPVVRIAEMVAVGRMNFASKNYRGAATRLARAAELEAKIPYREPPAWHQPVDAAVGAALLKAGDARGALAAFRRALERRPGSPWVLWGLAQAQTALGDAAGARASLALVDKSWAGDRKWLVLERL